MAGSSTRRQYIYIVKTHDIAKVEEVIGPIKDAPNWEASPLGLYVEAEICAEQVRRLRTIQSVTVFDKAQHILTGDDRELHTILKWSKQEENWMGSTTYHVALSFAGEQRHYVEEVARHLAALGVAVFYDGFERLKLWGQNGAEAFHAAFAKQATCVVMFISEEYVKKPWARHERRSTLSRMIHEQGQYILPVRFDDTPVPGLPEDVIYERASDYTPAQLSSMIAKKLGIRPFDGKASKAPPPRMTSLTGEVVFDYSSHNGRYIIGSEVLEFETKWSKASDTTIHVYNDPPSINGVALAAGARLISQVANAESLDYTSRSRTPVRGQIVVLRNAEGFYAAIHILGIKDDSRADDTDELRFRYAIQSNGSDNFKEFVDI